MKTHRVTPTLATLIVAAALSLLAAPAAAAPAPCPPDSVLSGTVCIDTYEASLWLVPPGETKLIRKIKAGTATLADLQAQGVQRGLVLGDLGLDCPVDGAGCLNVYAVSIAGVTPAAFVSWFQATAAARNASKRLPTSAEWQAAALGTPDTGGADDGATTCNTDNLVPGVTATGSRSACVSDVGAFDTVGNFYEWVADWVPLSTVCVGWTFKDDVMCLAGASAIFGPGALIRGGTFGNFTGAGVFAVDGRFFPQNVFSIVGFRAVR